MKALKIVGFYVCIFISIFVVFLATTIILEKIGILNFIYSFLAVLLCINSWQWLKLGWIIRIGETK